MSRYDCVIVGSGVAGLSSALALAPHGRVLLLTKGAIEDSATRYAQGGIAAALGAEDSAAAHLKDTIDAGAGLVDEHAARLLTAGATGRIANLLDLGVPFDRENGRIALGREAAHSAFRIVHAGGDATGLYLERTLVDRVRASRVEVHEHRMVTGILTGYGGVAGADVLDCESGATERIDTAALVLATGGAGRLYRYTTNPDVATGDGIALAFDAGAELMDLEFIQFHPTALRLPGVPSLLISEAARGEGAMLRDRSGHAFMADYDRRAELAPRDVVARAIQQQMAHTGADHVFLDLTHLPTEFVRARFPHIDQTCREHGLDLTREPLPVAPAAHYTMGGVRTGPGGETNVRGLFACGEVACTGVHGANRLASNSLLEGLVFGLRTAESVLAGVSPVPGDSSAVALPDASAGETRPPTLKELQCLMWDEAGIVRNGRGLDLARMALSAWQHSLPPAADRAGHVRHNLVLTGRLVVEAASMRQESRGAHYRSDFPEPSTGGLRHFVFKKGARDAE